MKKLNMNYLQIDVTFNKKKTKNTIIEASVCDVNGVYIFTTLFYDTSEDRPLPVISPLEKWRRRFGKVLLESDFLL